ncbi:hypothetical protein [Streptomyces sp. PSAA01]|uniref:hypothetical protein n=1 Tax=Streptomyces sp. PSAA01 TaxID=2912762 RepID=UPI002351EEA4|nr:hypothetical protein [Streptomyces sp. PSAA01]
MPVIIMVAIAVCIRIRPWGREGGWEVADQRHAEGQQGSGAQALERAGEDQRRHGGGQAAGDGADQEDDEPADQ